ncbi:adenine nucleotide alpha hydrolase [Vibrio aestuarianus]|uniref:Adenine nucleotide alpha hydrolase n=1 Tax=Vibrio aestuarianus TaxID=28171 RepID=A0ABD7YKV8_9VIBR|nr:adenine nucleotide alpha hydrolase [Vibrio aestuarianus]WGK85449.1 adenine nucleotide alpha hydrolase [Vibrio aestuarianus]CAH8218258.1 putative Adenine nucleotide alpha hydrolase [Vibrio aestuarianus]
MKKNVIISWSSGKDSTLTLERLLADTDYNVVGLYTTYVDNEVPFQATPLYVIDLQAQLVGLPVIKIKLPEVFPSNEVYQSTIINTLKSSDLEINAVAFGDIFCNGIADYRKSYIEPAGWECVLPLLGENSRALADEMIGCGIKTMIVTTDGQALEPKFCGQWYGDEFLQSLPLSVDPCGEDGEFHTLVTEAPCFIHGSLQLTLTHLEEGERFCHQRYQARILPIDKERV